MDKKTEKLEMVVSKYLTNFFVDFFFFRPSMKIYVQMEMINQFHFNLCTLNQFDPFHFGFITVSRLFLQTFFSALEGKKKAPLLAVFFLRSLSTTFSFSNERKHCIAQ